MIDNCADDWRIAMTWQRMMQIGMELLVCAVHPIPGRFYFLWTTKLSNHGGKIGSQWVPVDVTLSLPMFLRSGNIILDDDGPVNSLAQSLEKLSLFGWNCNSLIIV